MCYRSNSTESYGVTSQKRYNYHTKLRKIFTYFSLVYKGNRPRHHVLSCLRSFNGNARYSKFNHHNVGKMSKPTLNVITGAIGDAAMLVFLRNCVISKNNGRFFKRFWKSINCTRQNPFWVAKTWSGSQKIPSGLRQQFVLNIPVASKSGLCTQFHPGYNKNAVPTQVCKVDPVLHMLRWNIRTLFFSITVN